MSIADHVVPVVARGRYAAVGRRKAKMRLTGCRRYRAMAVIRMSCGKESRRLYELENSGVNA